MYILFNICCKMLSIVLTFIAFTLHENPISLHAVVLI